MQAKYSTAAFLIFQALLSFVNSQGIHKYNFKSVIPKSLEKRELKSEKLLIDEKLEYLFMGDVDIGKPSQGISRVLFDTGSYKFWVRGSKCVGCQPAGCAAGNKSACLSSFDGTASSTYFAGKAGSKLEYLSGQTIVGNTATDQVSFAGLRVSNFSFVEATSMPSTLTFDGVMGMGLFQGTASCSLTS